MINVVNKRTHKPHHFDFYIGRGSALGNPFTGSKELSKTKAQFQVSSREEAIEKYREWLLEQIYSGNQEVRDAMNRIYLMAKAGGLNLVCYCKPHACHGDVIKELIEQHLKPRQ